jgi:hypothetical protein
MLPRTQGQMYRLSVMPTFQDGERLGKHTPAFVVRNRHWERDFRFPEPDLSGVEIGWVDAVRPFVTHSDDTRVFLCKR